MNIELWLEELNGDPDEAFLSVGIKNGFQLVSAGTSFIPAEMNNYQSATNAAVMDKVEDALMEEIPAGNYVVTDTKPTIISALSNVPKAGSEEV